MGRDYNELNATWEDKLIEINCLNYCDREIDV